jgi:hypothetical protein
MSRIAKGLFSDPLFTNQRARRIAKSGGLGLSVFGLLAVHWNAQLVLSRRREVGKPSILVSGSMGFQHRNGESVMRNRIDIDYSHSRAIVQEIGERMRASLKEDRELPASLRMKIDRLGQSEDPSQLNVAKPTPRWWTRRPRKRR